MSPINKFCGEEENSQDPLPMKNPGYDNAVRGLYIETPFAIAARSQRGKAVTRRVFWVFEHPRNFREKSDTQKQSNQRCLVL